jgi:multidrug transporter EmrE-like cation transporter
MVFLLLQVACALIFTQLLRYSQRRGSGVLATSAVNYVAAAGASAIMLAVAWPNVSPAASWLPAAMGVASGALYFTHLLILLGSYERAGVGITAAFTGMGIVLPVFVSWLAWREPMTPFRWAALALLLPAILLMRPPTRPQKHLSLQADLLLMASFAVAGAVSLLHKAVNVYSPTCRPLYQACLFAVAAISSVGYARLRRLPFGREELSLGTVLGVSNVAATLFGLLALGALPAVIVFPTASSLNIASSVVASWFLWGERANGRQVVGLAASIAVVVLGNL